MTTSTKFSRPRHFNRLIFSQQHATKIIFDPAKGQQEIFFYQNAPEETLQFFPSLVEIRKRVRQVSYKMSRIDCPDVSQLYLAGQLTPQRLQQLLKRIDLFWQQTPHIQVSSKKWQQTILDMTSEKLTIRWRQYQKTRSYQTCFQYFLKTHLIDLQILKNEMVDFLKDEVYRDTTTSLWLSHGDLCLSNIFLVSPKKIMFVDPRGGTQYNELFIPQIYDLAKLSQCIYGNYDSILANKNISFSLQKKIFTHWLQQKKTNFRLLRLIEASHFLSLLPLHHDKPKLHIPFVRAALQALQEAP